MEDARTGASVRFGLDRRWATLAVAVALGAGGGSLLGFLTTPAGVVDAATVVSPPQVAPSTTRHPRSRFAGASSTTTARPRRYPAATAAPTPTSTVRPTTTATTLPPTTTTIQPTTTTTVASTTSSITSTSLGTTTTR
jgi:hypothetical protein